MQQKMKMSLVSLLALTAENFEVPKGEEHLFHCRIEIKQFSKETGERQSRPALQTFGKKWFKSEGLHYLKKQGYEVEILHDPYKWEQDNSERLAAEKAAAEAAAAEAAAKAEEEAKAAAAKAEEEAKAAAAKAEEEARAKMKAEILAELKAEGIIPQANQAPEESEAGEKTTKTKKN